MDMKNHRTAGSQTPGIERQQTFSRPSSLGPQLAFTLIELLTVISIIAVLAALTFPVLKGIKRRQYLNNAQAEMAQLETAIDRYKAAYGFYPPDNTTNVLVNQLYFELLGTTIVTNSSGQVAYQSLDDPTIQVPMASVSLVFGPGSSIGGFMNCTRPGASEDVRPAQSFLPNLKADQVSVFTNNFPNNKVPIKLIITSVGGPDSTYYPLGPNALGINPWRYNSSTPTNNPGGYDLWIQLSIAGRTNLICNWNQRVQFDSTLP